MGSMIKRIVLLATLLALAAPGLARADTVWYHPTADTPYQLGPDGGGSSSTTRQRDAATGEATALQHNAAGLSGSLGCVAQGPYTMFEVTHVTEGTVTELTVTFEDALVSPYAFLKASVLEDGAYLGTTNLRGAVLGAGEIVVGDFEATGTVTARFGIEVSSNCPSFDGGTARFTGVGFAEN